VGVVKLILEELLQALVVVPSLIIVRKGANPLALALAPWVAQMNHVQANANRVWWEVSRMFHSH